MTAWSSRSSERVNPEALRTVEERVMYVQHLFAYDFALKTIPAGALAVCASPLVLEIEHARVRRARGIATLDPWHLRRFAPGVLLQVAANAISLTAGRRARPSAAGGDCTLGDFSAGTRDPDEGVDLLAVCRP